VSNLPGATAAELAAEILSTPTPATGVVSGVAPVGRQWGVIQAVSLGPPFTVTLTLGGSTVSIAGIACLPGYTPTVGTTVPVDKSGDDLLVMGAGSGGVFSATSDPGAALNASQFALWLDATPGATVLHISAKDSGGTVRTGSIPLT
jgi:hypothetical protein